MSLWRKPSALLIVVCALVLPVGPARGASAGRVADPGLGVERTESGEVVLTWPGSCLAGDTDFEVYAGDLGSFNGAEAVVCSTAGATTLTFLATPGNRYFLVVSRNTAHEGSYGVDGAGAERSPSASACLPQLVSECPVSTVLADIDSGQPDPTGHYRWMDVADQLYAPGYQDTYDYTQADVELQLFPSATELSGYLVAANLKPHFAYQVKFAGIADTASNERIGLTGRWWQEEWSGSQWSNGQNLNNKGDGSSPNPNDDVYFARRDIPDATSPTGKRYRYTGYLVFDYFITDASGSTLLAIAQDSSYHVLWKTSQRARTAVDGPSKAESFDVQLPDPASAYDYDYPAANATIYGEWERLPVGGVALPPGAYEADLTLTEESFHGGGLAGGWAAAMGARIEFEIGAAP